MHAARGNRSTRFAGQASGSSRKNSAVVKAVIGILCCMVVLGIGFAAYLSPGGGMGGPSANSVLRHFAGEDVIETIVKTEEERILSAASFELPDWSAEFWTPIDVEVSSADPMVVLCKLAFHEHWKEPHKSPMFKDLVAISSCIGSNRRRERMSVLLEDIKEKSGTPAGRVIPPNGFVFHESRVGSTLVANMLATDPWALVFSESTPIANAIMHCDHCDRARKLEIFRNVLTLMGRSPFHKRLYVKFQSITTTKMDTALEAFPSTPWAFVFRQPVQTMMSHLDPLKGGSTVAAPCLRSKKSPPAKVTEALRAAGIAANRAPNEAWCAAHLSMLCYHALSAYSRFNSSTGSQRSLLINYESLPGIVPKALLPLFGKEISGPLLQRMNEESQPYSKSRGSRDQTFSGDSADKDDRATLAIKSNADKLLLASYTLLDELAQAAFTAVTGSARGRGESWSEVKQFPTATRSLSQGSGLSREVTTATNAAYQHSTAIPQVEYQPWLPFSNHHSSHRIEHVECPPSPPVGYPTEYSMMDIVKNWNPDSTEIPPLHYDSLCHFDYSNSTQLEHAYVYRAKEVPFVMYNVPEVDAVAKKWQDVRYLSKLLGSKSYRTETSKDNHFMYSSGSKRGGLRNWVPPTQVINTKFGDWLKIAVDGQNKTNEEREHHYFRASSDAGNEWIYDELPFFKPKRSFFIVEPREQRGIHCRFGMRSIISEAHFDGSRNFVAMMFGLRRWILTSPSQCKNMHMLQRPHPSARHSAVDWSKPDLDKFPNFAKVVGNEVILQPGDVLFVPTVWIHYIVSLNVNIQCNTRSGIWHGYDKDTRDCGF